MITKDGKDVSLDALTQDNYLVPAGEEKVYHVIQEVRQFDQRTGRKISKPRVQKYGRKIFEKVVRDQLMKQGYDFRILHDPTAYLAAEAKAKAAAAAKAQADKEAEVQARINAAVAEAVKKALEKRDAEEKKAKAKTKTEKETKAEE